MSTATAIRRSLARAGVAVVGLAVPAVAAPVLTSADARIAFVAPNVCEVTLTLAVGGAPAIEHRLEALAGSHTELLEVRGGAHDDEVREIGRTRALVIRPSGARYALRYRVTQPADRPHRCPLWLPTAPADGLTRNVRLSVALPAGTRASATMPSFAWTVAGSGDHARGAATTGPVGVATLGHLPAFVVVPFADEGSPRPWDVSRAMDAAAIGTLVLASAVWLRRRKSAS